MSGSAEIQTHQWKIAFPATKFWDGSSEFILIIFHYIKIRHIKCISWDDLKSQVENHNNNIVCDCMQLHIYCNAT